ncbi:MAG: UvrD-helicase domain-containing protein [Pseudomonadota bacterium]
MESLLKELNEKQKQAVTETNGPMLIVAGAGSGKTRVITYKVAYLVAKGIARPDEITAVTFTNKATGEMKSRIENILTERLKVCGMSSLNQLTVSTFHSLCARILRQHIDKLGYSLDFVIYDTEDQKSLISTLLDANNIDKKEFNPRDIVSYFSAIKNGTSMMRPDSRLTKVYADYEKELKKCNALDFGDLLTLTVKLFSEHKDVLDIYQDRAKFLFVDEYQDTNRIQYKLVKFLSAKHKNICVVGDEDQSIYKWRGADIKNILDFEHDYKGTKIIKLEENYRSTSNIINASASLISKNLQRKDKTLFTRHAAGEKIKTASLVNDISEAEYITLGIKNKINNGYNYSDMAVFYRINAQSRLMEEHLRKASVPYKVVGGVRFYDRKEIKDIIAYLRLVINPNDIVSLNRVINVPSRGIGKNTLERIEKLAAENKTGFYTALSGKIELTGISPAVQKKLGAFTSIIEELKKMNAENYSGSIILRTILDKTNYFEFLKQKNGHEADDRIDNISEFLGAMADFEEVSENKSIAAFLESVALVNDTDKESGDENGVRLMTLHSAKGLEFPVVFIQGVEYGLLPYISYGKDDINDIEEERRLLYVGMTRAKKELYLTWARSRRIFGGIKARHSSDFLDEIDEKFVESYNDEETYYKEVSKPKPSKTHSGYIYVREEPEESTGERGYIIGARVQHATYGDGIIRGVEGRGEKAKVTVHFRRYGVKKLIAGYANLVGN